jgi:DNA polymerase bacteriophage-type
MSDKLWMDFETYSEVDIRKHGGLQYAVHESTQVICLAYAFDNEPVQLWTPAIEFPDRIEDFMIEGSGKLYAHNALFEKRIWNNVMSRDFMMPLTHLERFVDTIALCNTYTLPAALKYAGRAMGIELGKLETGVRLINKCCKPDKNGNQPMYHEDPYTFKELFKYCVRDVEAMREVVNHLPRQELLPVEQEVWLMTMEMNELGLPVDVPAVNAILAYITKYSKHRMKEVPRITDGCVNTVNQIQKIKDWCFDQGLELDNLQADTIIKVLKQDDVPENVKELLKMRQELGRTSTAKYKKIKDLVYHGIVHDNLQYHGTGTGRWAGRGFQMQNLPRASVKNPEEYIDRFKRAFKIDDPVNVSKALIRPMILAPEGQQLIVSDYSSIENRVLAWLAGDEATLEGFRDDFDQYKDMAATLYQTTEDKVTKDQRQFGKVLILGAGYGMGAKRFGEVCEQWGLVVSKDEAKHLIEVYREKYYLIKTMWNEFKQAGVRAIMSGKKQTFGRLTLGTAKVKGTRWLAMKLPSGKCVYYMNPAIEDHTIPGYEYMGAVPTIMHTGVNPYTKKWSKLKITPGRLTENAVQATAREVMAQGMLNVQNNLPAIHLIGTVHDEALGLLDSYLDQDKYMTAFNKELCTIPWADGLPLKAEGYFSKRYKKG